MRSLTILSLAVGSLLAAACSTTPESAEVDALESSLNAQDYDATVQHLTSLPWLPWGYTPDGCYARAEYYSMLLASKGIPTNHIYAVAKGWSTLGGIWSWHVAPLVTKDSEPNKLYVLDPVYDQTRALTNVEWLAKMEHPNPKASDYPTVHVHPGNSYGAQFDTENRIVNPESPVAADYKEPSFGDMPAFEMDVVEHACQTMHRYINLEPNTTSAEKETKHTSLGIETQKLVAALADRGKIVGDPESLTARCTLGLSVEDADDADLDNR